MKTVNPEQAEHVKDAVCAAMETTRLEMDHPQRRTRTHAWARQCAMYLCKEMWPDTEFTQIAAAFGRDRTTARHAYRTVLSYRMEGDDLDELLTSIERDVLRRIRGKI